MLTSKQLKKKVKDCDLSFAEIAKAIGSHKSFVGWLIRYPSQIDPNSIYVKRVAYVIDVDYSSLVNYIKKARVDNKHLHNIEDYIPMYPNSITMKELQEIFQVSTVKIQGKLTVLENNPDIRVAALDDKDTVFARIK